MGLIDDGRGFELAALQLVEIIELLVPGAIFGRDLENRIVVVDDVVEDSRKIIDVQSHLVLQALGVLLELVQVALVFLRLVGLGTFLPAVADEERST